MSEMYIASPDWLKLCWIVLPWLTIYGVARVWAHVRLRELAVANVQAGAEWVAVTRETRPVTDIIPTGKALV